MWSYFNVPLEGHIRQGWLYMYYARAGFKIIMLVVIGTDCIDSYKSNYHTITTTTVPTFTKQWIWYVKRLHWNGTVDGNWNCLSKTMICIGYAITTTTVPTFTWYGIKQANNHIFINTQIAMHRKKYCIHWNGTVDGNWNCLSKTMICIGYGWNNLIDHEYVSFVVITIPSFPHSGLIIGFVTRITGLVSSVELHHAFAGKTGLSQKWEI
jgi:hypothetical protein